MFALCATIVATHVTGGVELLALLRQTIREPLVYGRICRRASLTTWSTRSQNGTMPVPSNAIVHINDDDSQVCDAVSSLISATGVRTCCHASAELFFKAFDSNVPGCIVVDVCLPGMSGLSVQERLKNEKVSTPLVILTGYADVPMAVKAMARGAYGFLQKPPRSHELLELVTSAVNWHHTSLTQIARLDLRSEKLTRLTEREREILQYVIDGKPSKEIAALLGISQRTVEQHRSHIMQKLEVDSLAELVRLAVPSRENSPTVRLGNRIES